MAKRVDFNKSNPSSPRTNKFDRLNKPPQKGKKSILSIIGRVLLYIWISTIVAVVVFKFVPVYFTPTMASRKIDALIEGEPSKIHSQWSSLDEIDRNCALAVIASERV
jgi:monofunctional biosynthetic peptidoglycan transglycosylase